MASIYEQTLQVMLGRIAGRRPVTANVRRSHKTMIPRDECPAIYLAEATDEVKGGTNCTSRRQFTAVVRVFVRDDDGYATMDDLVLAVVERLNPEAVGYTAYPAGVTVELGRIGVDEELADGDALRKDIYLPVTYTAGYWSLGAP